jgi:hypothetical protein
MTAENSPFARRQDNNNGGLELKQEQAINHTHSAYIFRACEVNAFCHRQDTPKGEDYRNIPCIYLSSLEYLSQKL